MHQILQNIAKVLKLKGIEMPYVEKNLTKDEKVIQKAKLHWFIYVRALVIFLFSFLFLNDPDTHGIGIFFITLSLALLLSAWIQTKTTELAVTNKRVIAKYGLISRQTIELNLNKIEGLNVNQGVTGRIFNFGDVIINGTGGKQSPIKYIARPLTFRKTVNEAIES